MLYDASLSHRAWYDYIYRFMARPFVGSELYYRLSGMMRVRHSSGHIHVFQRENKRVWVPNLMLARETVIEGAQFSLEARSREGSQLLCAF